MSKHGATWWSGRFLRSLERLGMTTRLRRGHNYYLEGRVLRLDVQPGVVSSVVRGTEDYHCQIYFEPLSDMEWTESLDRLALGDLSAAAFLATGRMPPQIENFFAPSGRRLLPQAATDLELECSCRDSANPCKHLAATAYVLVWTETRTCCSCCGAVARLKWRRSCAVVGTVTSPRTWLGRHRS